MRASSTVDDLLRAADAAGYAMATDDDGRSGADTSVASAAEQSAHGTRAASILAAAGTVSAPIGRARPAVEAMRATVYNYLGFGATA